MSQSRRTFIISVTTIDHPRYAAALARAVDQLRRSQEAGEPQKAALRALVAASAEHSATLRFYDSVLTIDGVEIPTADPRLSAFAERLTAHGIEEIVIARGAEALELLALTSGLAADAGHGRIKEKLRDAASTRVMVVVHQQVDPTQKRVTVSGAFEKQKENQATMAEWNKFLNQGSGTRAGGDRQVDLGLKAEATGEIEIDLLKGGGITPQPAAAKAVPTSSGTIQPIAPAAQAPAAPRLESPATLQATTPLGIALAKVLMDAYGKDILTRLTVLQRHIEDAFSRGSVPEAIDAVNTLVEVESKAGDQSVRNVYGVILGRILGRTVLTKVAPYMQDAKRRNRAAAVLRRGGDAGTGLLMQLIIEAQTLGERLVYVNLLRGMDGGIDKLVAQLSSQRGELQVVRNIAELCGEARVDAAVPYLARMASDHDERLRRTALVAMAKIGGAQSVEPLRTAFKSGAPELKAAIANSVNGASARPLTAVFARLADEEDNPDVARALIKAIGRIGTPEARQALERAAAQKSLFSRKAKITREAAEEVLRTLAPTTAG